MKKIFGFAAGALLAAVAVPGVAQAQNAYTVTTVNLRAGPGLEYPIVFPVPGNVALQTYGCLNDWSWCDVTVSGYRGWMAGDYIGYVYESRWVPVYEYGPRYNLPIISFNFGSYWDTHYRNRPWYSQRTRWERYDREHHDDHRPPQHREMPKTLPHADGHSGGQWNNNRNDNDRRDGARNNDGRNDNNRNDNDRRDGKWDKDRKSDNDNRTITPVTPNRTVTAPSKADAPNRTVVNPPKVDTPTKAVVTPPAPPKATPPVNQDANRRDDGNRGGDKGNKGGNNHGNDKDDDDGRGNSDKR